MSDDEYITIEQAEARYRVSRSTLYRYLPAGETTRWRRPPDRRVYLRVAELERRLPEWRRRLLPAQN